MTDRIIPTILVGGSGTRLWPLSRELYPKQFLPLFGKRTMLQETLKRLDGLAGCAGPIITCNANHRFLAAEQLREIGSEPAAIMLEPVGRNTAPAVAVAALHAAKSNDDPILIVLPADHVIANRAAFRRAIKAGLGPARDGKLVVFGVVPTAPETGYGYIRRGAALDDVYKVDAFVEKPDLATAESYLGDGGYYWNSGMFMFRASSYLKELERFAPDMVAACKLALGNAAGDMDFTRLDHEAFSACPSDSIDYAVMEKTDNAVVVPLDAGWSDVGSWAALADLHPADADGNVTVGDVVAEDARNCYLHANSRMLAVVGLEDYVVIETVDAVLIARKDRVQDVKTIVKRLGAEGRSEILLHRKVSRPWGSYDGVDQGERFQVKRLVVKPGARLSLQKHHHRAEHWIVVRGTAEVTRDDETFLIGENESTFIPMGARHRLANPGKIPLELIEVQSGAYLGEDDIVRYDDVYGRVKEKS
ncbi:MAG TPA: mannose-1-phosphate guanylyltransferase/mannose-6-phosphate isomerase [Gammaproteobacteria bacterium]|nr:mannose-1-phosphate guanylyltransferase/mannose-6-phosphate isomerase [Gammaproteobacteria bacterium]